MLCPHKNHCKLYSDVSETCNRTGGAYYEDRDASCKRKLDKKFSKLNVFLVLGFAFMLMLVMVGSVGAVGTIPIGFNPTDDIINQGIPFKQGLVLNSSQIDVIGYDEDVRVLANWSDGSVKWALITFENNNSANALINYGTDVNNIALNIMNVTDLTNNIVINTGNLLTNFSKVYGMITTLKTDDDLDGTFDTEYLTTGTGSGKGLYSRIKFNGVSYQQGGCNKYIIDAGEIMTKIFAECNYTNINDMRQEFEFTFYRNKSIFLLNTALVNGNTSVKEFISGDYYGLIYFGNYNGSNLDLINYSDSLNHAVNLNQLTSSYVGLSYGSKTFGVYIESKNNSKNGVVTTQVNTSLNNSEVFRFRGASTFNAGLSIRYNYKLGASNNIKYNSSIINFNVNLGVLPYSYWLSVLNNTNLIKESNNYNLNENSGYLDSLTALYKNQVKTSGSFFGGYWSRNYPSNDYSFDGWIQDSLIRGYIKTGNTSIYNQLIEEQDVLNSISFNVFTNLSHPINGLVSYHPADEIFSGHGGYQRPSGLINTYYLTGNLRNKETLNRGHIGFNNAFSVFSNQTIPFVNITGDPFSFGEVITHRDGVHARYFVEYGDFYNDSIAYNNAFLMLRNMYNLTNQTDGSISYKFSFKTGSLNNTILKELMQSYTREGFIAYLEYNNTNYFDEQLKLISNWSINQFNLINKGYWSYTQYENEQDSSNIQYPWLNVWSCYSLLKTAEYTEYRTDDIKLLCKKAMSYWIADQLQDGRWYNSDEEGNTIIYSMYTSVDMAPYVLEQLNKTYLLKFITSQRFYNETGDSNITYNRYDNYYFTINRDKLQNQITNINVDYNNGDDVYDLIKHRLIEEDTDGTINVNISSFENRVYTVQPLNYLNLLNTSLANLYNTSNGVVDEDIILSGFRLRESIGIGKGLNDEGDIAGNVPIWFSSSTNTEKHIASNLSDMITTTIVMNVDNCKNIGNIKQTSPSGYSITYQNGYFTRDYTCENNIVTIQNVLIEPSSESNEFTITYDCDQFTKIGYNLIALLTALALVALAIGFVWMRWQNGGANASDLIFLFVMLVIAIVLYLSITQIIGGACPIN